MINYIKEKYSVLNLAVLVCIYFKINFKVNIDKLLTLLFTNGDFNELRYTLLMVIILCMVKTTFIYK